MVKFSEMSFSEKITLLVTVVGLIISVVALKIAHQANIFSSENSDLIYDTEVVAKKMEKPQEFDFESGIIKLEFPIEITPKIEQGKVRNVYSVTINENEDYSITRLEKSNKNEMKAIYKLRGTAEQIEKSPMDMFIFYVDYTNNIYYDYVLFLPTYGENKPGIKVNGVAKSKKGLLLMSVKTVPFTQYDLLSKGFYDEELQTEDYTFLKHDDVLQEIRDIKKYFNELIL